MYQLKMFNANGDEIMSLLSTKEDCEYWIAMNPYWQYTLTWSDTDE